MIEYWWSFYLQCTCMIENSVIASIHRATKIQPYDHNHGQANWQSNTFEFPWQFGHLLIIENSCTNTFIFRVSTQLYNLSLIFADSANGFWSSKDDLSCHKLYSNLIMEHVWSTIIAIYISIFITWNF